MLGVLALLRGMVVAGSVLVVAGFVVLLYVAGRRYLAIPIALNENRTAWQAFMDSRTRLAGHRGDAASAVFLIVLPLAVLDSFVSPAINRLGDHRFAGVYADQVVSAAWGTLVGVLQPCLFAALAWHVYNDLGRSRGALVGRKETTGAPPVAET